MLKKIIRKKPIVSIVVGAAVFSAAFAFAASLAVGSQSLGAGNAAVAACDANGVSVAYSPTYGTTGGAGYKVGSVTVSGIDATSCAGGTVHVDVVDASNASIASGNSGAVAATSEAVSLDTPVDVSSIAKVFAYVSK